MNRNRRIFVESYLRRKKRKKKKKIKRCAKFFRFGYVLCMYSAKINLKVKRERKKKEFEHKIEKNKIEKHCTYIDLLTIIFA